MSNELKTINDFEIAADKVLEKALEKAYNINETRKQLIGSLELIKEQKGIYDHRVEYGGTTTWESIYPDPEIRELAKEASEKFGFKIPSETKDKPEHIKHYPYKFVEVYYLLYLDGEREYWTDSEQSGFLTQDDVKGDGEPKLITEYAWKLEEPGKEIFDIYVNVPQPVHYIQLECVIKRDGVDFLQAIKETGYI